MAGKRFVKQKVKKRIFLKRVRNRLDLEVGNYFRLLLEKQREDPEHPKAGFWTGIRLVMPVIDALSSVLFKRGSKDTRPKAVRFMGRELGIEYPFIAWEMYRHSLIHGDEMRGISYRNKRVRWGLSVDLGSHIFLAGQSSIDVVKLYKDLMAFLEREIPKAKGFVYVDRHVKYSRNIKQELKKEILEIQD